MDHFMVTKPGGQLRSLPTTCLPAYYTESSTDIADHVGVKVKVMCHSDVEDGGTMCTLLFAASVQKRSRSGMCGTQVDGMMCGVWS
eukprot:3700075-Rhodomonas_salina.1